VLIWLQVRPCGNHRRGSGLCRKGRSANCHAPGDRNALSMLMRVAPRLIDLCAALFAARDRSHAPGPTAGARAHVIQPDD
jgi:hypothetical protein